MIKRFVLWNIHIYQRYVSPKKWFCCPYSPSCSCYAVEAIEKYGLWRGGRLTIWRLLRCNPFTKGGYDPVPEEKRCRW